MEEHQIEKQEKRTGKFRRTSDISLARLAAAHNELKAEIDEVRQRDFARTDRVPIARPVHMPRWIIGIIFSALAILLPVVGTLFAYFRTQERELIRNEDSIQQLQQQHAEDKAKQEMLEKQIWDLMREDGK